MLGTNNALHRQLAKGGAHLVRRGTRCSQTLEPSQKSSFRHPPTSSVLATHNGLRESVKNVHSKEGRMSLQKAIVMYCIRVEPLFHMFPNFWSRLQDVGNLYSLDSSSAYALGQIGGSFQESLLVAGAVQSNCPAFGLRITETTSWKFN